MDKTCSIMFLSTLAHVHRNNVQLLKKIKVFSSTSWWRKTQENKMKQKLIQAVLYYLLDMHFGLNLFSCGDMLIKTPRLIFIPELSMH